RDWSSDVCSSDLGLGDQGEEDPQTRVGIPKKPKALLGFGSGQDLLASRYGAYHAALYREDGVPLGPYLPRTGVPVEEDSLLLSGSGTGYHWYRYPVPRPVRYPIPFAEAKDREKGRSLRYLMSGGAGIGFPRRSPLRGSGIGNQIRPPLSVSQILHNLGAGNLIGGDADQESPIPVVQRPPEK